jgi:RNA polymerase sigma factor (sigma-70 family)
MYMATKQLSGVIHHLRRAGLTDDDLLRDYLSGRDEAALAALVCRHAPMVWGVCRRVLNNGHDAEDAFQATFLVFVRKAASIAAPELLANWLYGVAHQTAIKARANVAKRKTRERQGDMPEPAVPEQDLWMDLRPLLDEELSRLPDIYRAVIVLSDLEGKTRNEAARQLGLPEGTVASRLARARTMLAKRLSARGVTLPGGALAALLAHEVASAGVPSLVVSNAIKAAGVVGAGHAAAGLVSGQVAALTDEVLRAMGSNKFKLFVAVVLVLCTMGTGATILSRRTSAAPTDPPPTPVAGAETPGQRERPKERPKAPPRDLSKIQPPGGVPLRVGERGKEISVEYLKQATKRLESAPPEDLNKWVVELERIMDEKLNGDLAKQGCCTHFVTRLSLAFDDLKWNAEAADKLLKRAQTMPPAEAKAWKAEFEALLKKEIGQTDKEVLDGGPSYAVPLVLIPVDALHEGRKYSVERGKKYLGRLKQLAAEDVSLWKDKVDQFAGTELDAAVNIILLDEYFDDEKFQRETFQTAVAKVKK